MNKTVVFAGPSLFKGYEFFKNIATFLPPVRAGDLLNTVINNPEVKLIVIADGFFFEQLSVLHREIIEVINSGVKVYGCSSLGALRAVELRNFGMYGFGSVYDYYLQHQDTGDDEVGLIHSDASSSYQHLSIPLINLRLLQLTICDSSRNLLLRDIISLFEQLSFSDRSKSYLLKLAKTHPDKYNFYLDCIELLDTSYFDYKSIDLAYLLLNLWTLPDEDIEPSMSSYFTHENVANFLPTIMQGIISGQSDTIRYVLSPHRSLATSNVNDSVTELGYRDLSLLASPFHIQILRMQSYRKMLLKEALSNGLCISSKEVFLVLSQLTEKYQVSDITALARRLNLTKFELLKLGVEEALILYSEFQIFSSASMALNVGSYFSTLRTQGLFPDFSKKSIKAAFITLKNVFTGKNPLEAYRTFKILLNTRFFDDHLSCLFLDPLNYPQPDLFNYKKNSKTEYTESIQRLSSIHGE
jgi:hypothetical protein